MSFVVREETVDRSSFVAVRTPNAERQRRERRTTRARSAASALVVLVVFAASLSAQSGAKNGEWRTWAGDLGATRYAPLDQIDATNFSKLEVAWRFKTDNLGPRPDFNLQASPLMVNGRLYFTAGSRRAAVAVNAANGELLWIHRLEEGARADNSS